MAPLVPRQNMALLHLQLPLRPRYSDHPSRHRFTPLHHRHLLRRFSTPTCLRSCTGPLPSFSLRLPLPTPITPLYLLKPFLLSQWQPILAGWLCSGISVYSLSQIVPKAGNLSLFMSRIDALSLQKEGLILAAVFLVRTIVSYLQQAFLWDAALNCVYEVRVFVYEKVLQRDLGFFEGKDGMSSGDIAYRITAEADDVADTVHSLLNTIVPSTLQILVMGRQMLVISPEFSLFSALVIPAIALIIGLLGERLRQMSNQAHLAAASLAAYLNEVLPAILFVKANNAELSENIRFQSRASADLLACLKKKKLKSLIPQIVLILYLGILFGFCAASMALSRGSFDCSAMVSFVTSLYLLIEPVQGVGKAYNEIKQGEPAVDRLFSLTSSESQVKEMSHSIDLDHVSGEVRFCGVSFKYHESSRLVLNEVDLHIEPGQTVALIGPSGGGKTMIAKLLLRLYDPLCGSIYIDGHDIQNIRLERLRRHVALVSQDITLFSGTISENIGYRDLMAKIDMKKVELAARTANADEFIQTLPSKYHTNIGPRGAILSGGQRQRLAIARALYQDPSILIMDEATSSLDSRSELLVRQALQLILETRTVLVIAHRPETVLMAERVLLLKDGRLHELNRSSFGYSANNFGTLGS